MEYQMEEETNQIITLTSPVVEGRLDTLPAWMNIDTTTGNTVWVIAYTTVAFDVMDEALRASVPLEEIYGVARSWPEAVSMSDAARDRGATMTRIATCNIGW